jgi:predicted transcriptional regulator
MLYRTTFNCENELHERLKLQAKAEDRTKTAVINRAIKEYLDKHEIKE